MTPDRNKRTDGFLSMAGWGSARRRHLAGDASDRRYERLTLNEKSAVLMDAPPGTGDDPASFVLIAKHLLSLGLSAPRILAQDLNQGFLLLEDLGDDLFARLLEKEPARELELYSAASDALVHLQRAAPPADLPNLSATDWANAACFALDWYRQAITNDSADATGFRASLAEAIAHHADGERVLILRDYHAENLLWLPDRSGLARAGLLDFQLGQLGQPGYDLVSLLQDARRDVRPETETAMILRFVAATGRDHTAFSRSFDVLGAQRALRILGIFARLCLVSGKSAYIDLIPRVWGNLQRNLRNPALHELSQICAELLPPPTVENLRKIKDQCGRIPFQ